MISSESFYKVSFWTLLWFFTIILSFGSGASMAIIFSPAKMTIQNYNAYEDVIQPSFSPEETLDQKKEAVENRINQKIRRKK